MDTLTLALVLNYAKKQAEEAKKEGFKVQVEQDRSILDRAGEEKVFYFLPKSTVKPSDGYDEFIYTNNNWEKVGATDVDLSSIIVSAKVNDNGTISFYDADGNLLFTTTGASVIGPQGEPGTDYVLTPKDKADIADIVLQELPTTEGVLYGN